MRQESFTLQEQSKGPHTTNDGAASPEFVPQEPPHGKIIKFRKQASPEEITIEVTRKSIHLLIAFVPLMLSMSRPFTIAFLIAGTGLYAVFESLRMHGIRVPLVSWLTARAARIRDKGNFVVGPVTLGLGALLSVLLFKPVSASIAVYVLAFGDGLSSLVGKTVGRTRLPLTGGKSLEGTLTCFAVSFLSCFFVSGKPEASLIVAAVSTIVEAVPTKDWDNILLPLAAGLAATLTRL